MELWVKWSTTMMEHMQLLSIAGTKAGEVTITAKTSNNKAGTVKLTLTEKVEKPKLEPTFTVSVLKASQKAKPSGFVTYLITLQGKDGYSDSVSLFATDMPKSLEANLSI